MLFNDFDGRWPHGPQSGLGFLVEDINVIEITRKTVYIKSVAYDKLFGNLKTHIIGIDFIDKSFGLEQKCGYAQ